MSWGLVIVVMDFLVRLLCGKYAGEIGEVACWVNIAEMSGLGSLSAAQTKTGKQACSSDDDGISVLTKRRRSWSTSFDFMLNSSE